MVDYLLVKESIELLGTLMISMLVTLKVLVLLVDACKNPNNALSFVVIIKNKENKTLEIVIWLLKNLLRLLKLKVTDQESDQVTDQVTEHKDLMLKDFELKNID